MSDAPQDNLMQNPDRPSRKSQFQARLDNQKNQLERHGNFAEVVIRTTPEGTDMINFARLWEYVLVQADRKTRGYVAKNSREDFEATRQAFDDSIEFMAARLKDAIARHELDLTGNNFISRVGQRYKIAERSKKSAKSEAAAKPTVEKTKAPKRAAKAAAPAVDDIDEI